MPPHRKAVSRYGQLQQSVIRTLEVKSFFMDEVSMDTQVSLRQAYMIMFDFLEGHYNRNGKPDEIGNLLGQLALWDSANGKEPMDGAVFPDWLKSASSVLKEDELGGYKNIDIKLT